MVAVSGNEVEFMFFRPKARRVELVGDFNNWGQAETPMTRYSDGYWRARLRLPSGMFRFRYRADGQWYTDFGAFGVDHGPYGLDSVVLVRPAARSQPRMIRLAGGRTGATWHRPRGPDA
ncbi:MAG TPA: hypothetical protein VNA25_00375 [Phycisphaerae bacterium]|nr:hypothetical protein [Phycisphaerae bacterium]HUT56308.1 hypothetical protein [Phycisphaerae bacterium]